MNVGPRARTAAAACLACSLLQASAAAPIQVGLDRGAVAEAVRIGRSGQAAFHAAYRVQVDDEVVRHLEIVTEFRRVVRLTEEREGMGDATWDASRAAEALRPFRGLVDLVMFLQFSPRNTYRVMPQYSAVLYDRESGEPIRPVDSYSTTAYVGGQPAPPGTPILSGTVTLTFDAARLKASDSLLAGILLDGRELRRVPLDLAGMR